MKIRRRIGDGRPERGATLPEYALGLGLVVVVCIGGISVLQDESSGALDEQAAIAGGGNELSGAGYSYGGGGGGSTGSATTGGPPPPSTTVVDDVNLKNAKASKDKANNNVWIANVTVEVNSQGAAVEGATVQVTFANGAFSTTTTCPQTSNNKGEVECELANIPKAITSVTITVDTITGSNLTYTPPTPKESTSLNQPNGM